MVLLTSRNILLEHHVVQLTVVNEVILEPG
jgi:hypothetical protein